VSGVRTETVHQVIYEGTNDETSIWELEEFIAAIKACGGDDSAVIVVTGSQRIQMIWRQDEPA
jgi:hypothetical protein